MINYIFYDRSLGFKNLLQLQDITVFMMMRMFMTSFYQRFFRTKLTDNFGKEDTIEFYSLT